MIRIRLALTLVVLFLAVHLVAAESYYVGTCRIAAFGTISAAVAAVPAGSTIYVCPGTYPEQVIISKPLTLQGVFDSGSSQAVIAMPSSGLAMMPSVAFMIDVAGQIEVTTGPVNITNITVDGNATSSTCPSPYMGIFYSSGSSGTISEVETRNQNCGLNGIGILVENGVGSTSTVTIQNSNFQGSNTYAGILTWSTQTPSSLDVVIKNNYVASAQWAIYTGGNASDTISDNMVNVGSQGSGIVVQAPDTEVSGNVVNGGWAGIEVLRASTVARNTVTNANWGIAVLAGPTTVVGNSVSFGEDGIVLDTPDNTASVSKNTISNTSVGIEFSCTSGTVTGNIINGATTGMDTVPAAFDQTNQFYNVQTVRTGGPC